VQTYPVLVEGGNLIVILNHDGEDDETPDGVEESRLQPSRGFEI
jgi:hypothetical protein